MMRSERTRLDWSAQWGADSSQNRINPVAEAINHAQFALQMPELPHGGPMKLDQCTKWLQRETVGVPLGECRSKVSSQQEVAEHDATHPCGT